MTDKPLMRYDGVADELVPITQDWVNSIQQSVNELVAERNDLRNRLQEPINGERNYFDSDVVVKVFRGLAERLVCQQVVDGKVSFEYLQQQVELGVKTFVSELVKHQDDKANG